MRRLALILLAATLAGPAAAQSALRNAELSARLFEAAQDLNDPMLAVAAARLRKSVLARQVDRPHVTSGGQPAGAVPADRLLSWQDMLAAAQEMAQGNASLLALAEDVKFAGTKGVSSGQVYSITVIGAGGRDVYEPMPFAAGQYAEVYVEAELPEADLNILVRDPTGQVVCEDSDVSAIAYCGWRPETSQDFVLEVENLGATASSYSLITN